MKNDRCIAAGGFTVVEAVVFLAAIIVLAGLLVPVMARKRENARRASCQSNLKSMSLHAIAYMQDYDKRFPPLTGDSVAASANYGWAGAMSSYLTSFQVLQCPSEVNPPAPNPTQRGFSDYWFNANLSKVREDSLNYVSNTFLFGDGAGGTAAYALSVPEAGPPYRWMNRHLDGADYSFVDGHVKWLMPKEPSIAAASSSVFTFGT